MSDKISAPAKINLNLKVVGVRSDGYLLLSSAVAFADLCDEIEVKDAAEFSVKLSGEFAKHIDNPKDTTLHRAHAAMKKLSPGLPNFEISLRKNIPVGGGLGGGSSDAAAFIRYIAEKYRPAARENDLYAAALCVGADVPVCLCGRAAVFSGIGEKIKPAASKYAGKSAILVNPGARLLTKDVLGLFKKEMRGGAAPARNSGAAAGNDFLDCAARLEPQIKEILTLIDAAEGCVLCGMSGSGPTCFAIFDGEGARDAAASKFNPRYWIKKCAIKP